MAKQRFGLGRGLDALISGASDVISPQPPAGTTPSSSTTAEAVPLVSLESIIPNPHQPRRVFHDDDPRLLDLSASIKEHGLIQPIIVTRLQPKDEQAAQIAANDWFGAESPNEAKIVSASDTPKVEFQIIAGERRWRAARLAGLSEVPVVIKDVTPLQMLELALIENIQRADLNPIEEALAYQALVQEFGLTQEMVAKQVGKDRSTITNALRLLQLSPRVRDALMNQLENFTEGHARALVGITREEDQVQAMNQIIALRLNVRQAEELAARIKAAENVEQAVKNVAPLQRSPAMDDLEAHFRNALMVKVDLKCNARGKGTLVLHFNNQEELESLYQRIVPQDDA